MIPEHNFERMKKYKITVPTGSGKKEIVRARYKGLIEGTHVFENEASYVVAEDDQIVVGGDIINQKLHLSSIGIGRINKSLLGLTRKINKLEQTNNKK
ncbi:MAG: hypothetical protein KKF48_01775 [Nanoarchaeota archaeon]|nr:hypothetical protein [Nanoarchaeota archaeon]MBU1027750.1 hypothetical protein [Nanoarchaeota archaeon]